MGHPLKWDIRVILAQCQSHQPEDFVKLKESINGVKMQYFGLRGPGVLRNADTHYYVQPTFGSHFPPELWFLCNKDNPFNALTDKSLATWKRKQNGSITHKTKAARPIPTISPQKADEFNNALIDTLLLVQYLNERRVADVYLRVRRRVRKIIATFAWQCLQERSMEWRLDKVFRNKWIDGFDKWERNHLEQVEANILAALKYGLGKAGCDPEVLEKIEQNNGPLRLLKEPWGKPEDNLRLTEQGDWERVEVKDKDNDNEKHEEEDTRTVLTTVLTNTQIRLENEEPGLYYKADTVSEFIDSDLEDEPSPELLAAIARVQNRSSNVDPGILPSIFKRGEVIQIIGLCGWPTGRCCEATICWIMAGRL